MSDRCIRIGVCVCVCVCVCVQMCGAGLFGKIMSLWWHFCFNVVVLFSLSATKHIPPDKCIGALCVQVCVCERTMFSHNCDRLFGNA